jgi:thiazole biosynthesis protein ThiH
MPAWIDPSPWLDGRASTPADVERALRCDEPGPRELATLLSPAAHPFIEVMAQRARALTQRHFGRTISLYAPLYLANHCTSGCAYCGFASDRTQPRRRLEPPEAEKELAMLKEMGFEEVLLLTGERTSHAGFDYLLECVSLAAQRFHAVGIEAFPMTTREYGLLAEAGCSGVTVYQETYDPRQYDRLHRWGPKKDYLDRLEAPARAGSGMRTVGLGVLLGLSDPASTPSASCATRAICSGFTGSRGSHFRSLVCNPRRAISRRRYPSTRFGSRGWCSRSGSFSRMSRSCSRRGNGRNSGTAWRGSASRR